MTCSQSAPVLMGNRALRALCMFCATLYNRWSILYMLFISSYYIGLAEANPDEA